MQDTTRPYHISLTDLRPAQWIDEMRALGETFGFFEPLGKRHNATFIEEGDTLLVSFESLPAIQALSEDARPDGFDIAREKGWSCLSVISMRDTWFRDGEVYGFFDQLTDDGFFEDFDQVIFYGAGPCGYAACAFSVTAPGATVIALEPQATLDPRVTEWDDRFTEMRKLDFTDRYGFAPDMLEAAERAYIIYDPQKPLDAMHSALFERGGITRFRARHLGGGMQSHLARMGVLNDLVHSASAGTLDAARFAALYRKRRDHVSYCKRLFSAIDETERPYMAEAVCAYIVDHWGAPRYRRKLKKLRNARDCPDDDSDDEEAAS
ncbi:phosphoadenosine phosphosulfate reductase [Marivita sp. GX14005]|uniref:phosphoadenosine phosphosulfate reductase n=1 Tax=Marivita sp. GX14005 TaxID=2942276 RepID=UPI002018D4A2|nr:phosphoadenosine phosphosulfate reductase [Marivita sp. GX14005]MCL3883416.1 phosphoadenosine phosphosulfate reductase [Marivita sp. GX14005]